MQASYKTTLSICVGFLVLHHFWGFEWMFYAAALVGAASLISSKVAIWIAIGWEHLGKALGYVNSRIILSAVYFLILLPMSAFYKLSKSKTLQLQKSERSYFQERNHVFAMEDLKKSGKYMFDTYFHLKVGKTVKTILTYH